MPATGVAPPIRAIHKITSITVGERGNRDLSGLDELKASIVRDDLIHPLILTPDRHLVLGARRLEACRQLGWTDIPAMTVTWIWQGLEYLETEHRDPRCLKPLTVQEAMGVDMALRELQWWPTAYPVPGAPAKGGSVGNERRKRIASLLGLNPSRYEHARELWQAAHGYREKHGTRTPIPPDAHDHAAALMAGVHAQPDINRAYAAYRAAYDPPRRSGGQEPPPQQNSLPVRSTRADGRRSPQRAQAAQIRAGLASISGTLAALMSIRGIDPAIPDDQLGDWAGDITGFIRDLTTFRKRLEKGQQ